MILLKNYFTSSQLWNIEEVTKPGKFKLPTVFFCTFPSSKAGNYFILFFYYHRVFFSSVDRYWHVTTKKTLDKERAVHIYSHNFEMFFFLFRCKQKAMVKAWNILKKKCIDPFTFHWTCEELNRVHWVH